MSDRNGSGEAEMSERPFLPRSDTEQLLSYYHSPIADGAQPRPHRQLSGGSTSSSDYSDSSHSAYSELSKPENARRRQSNPSEGGSDRRRLAIVEMDTVVETSVKSRRGIDIGSLALVAPPDAAPQSYTQLTPPTTTSIPDSSKGHFRSASEASKKSSPRDISIIGTSSAPIVLEAVQENALRLPIFIHPQSRSPSPSPIRPPIKRRSTGQSITILTPEIGSEKQIDIPVASPVVVNINPSNVYPMASETKQAPSSYLNYQPGVHATAGPLPPPPRASFTIDVHAPPPPRPPRLHSPPPSSSTSYPVTARSASPIRPHRRGDIESVKQALQLPPSVSKALASRSRSRSPQPSDRESESRIGGTPRYVPVTRRSVANNKSSPPLNSVSTPESLPSEVTTSATRSIHRREGAFSPSSGDTSSTTLSESDAVIPPSLRRVDHHLGDDLSLPTIRQVDDKGPPITEVHPLKPPFYLAPELGTGSGSSTSSYGTPHPRESDLPSRGSSSMQSRGSPLIPDDGWVNVSREEGTADTLDEGLSRRAHVSHSYTHSAEGSGLRVSPSTSFSPSSSRSRSPSSHGHDGGASPSRHTSASGRSIAPSPPPKSFRHSLTNGLKRMSLPRSPSGRSLGRASSVSRRDKDRSPRVSSSSSSGEGGVGVVLSTSPSPSVSSHPLPALPLSMSPVTSPVMPLREIQMNAYAGHGMDREDTHGQTPTRKAYAQQAVRSARIKSMRPPAMFCSEVTLKKSPGERCVLYAQKINELYMYDCGLEDWVMEARIRGSNPTRSSAVSLGPSSPSTVPFTTQPRQTSHSSVISEATFPRRPDATSATDLTVKEAQNISPPTGPPPLPYPSLAISNQRANPPKVSSRSSASNGTSTPPSPLRSLAPSMPTSRTGGFFASLGRKASVNRKDKSMLPPPLASASSNGGRLTKSPPSNHHHHQNITPPSTVNASPSSATRTSNSVSPSVPGGPRAPPNRMLRSQTIMVSPLPGQSGVRASMGPTVGRRPSLYNIPSGDSVHIVSTSSSIGHSSHAFSSSGSSPSNPKVSSPPSKYYSQAQPQSRSQAQQDPEFMRQVDKLADLLPHADRNVLAGYLRRAGQDILAIGQYLEDEKNGELKRD